VIGIGRLAAALILGIVLPEARAVAQNSSLMDMNMDMGCMLMAGMHEMQVSVYQSGATEDSCKDIPSPGPSLITISSASKELRDMTTEVRIVRGAEGDSTAVSGNLDPVTLAYLPPKSYPRGVITLPANFDKPGKYAVLVTVRDAKDMAMSGRLGLTVGQVSRQWIIVYILSGIILAAAFGFYLRDLGRKSGVRWFCVWSFLFQQDGSTAPEVDVGWRKIETYKPGEKIGGQTRGLRVVSTQRTRGIRMILWDERRRRLISFREMHTATSMTGGMKLPEIRQ
jgi:hypothetical protein